MAHPAVAEDLLAAFAAFAPISNHVKRQDRTQLLNLQGIVASNAGQFGDEYAGRWRNGDPGLLGDVGGRTSDKRGVGKALRDDEHASISDALRKCAPLATNWRLTSSTSGASTTTEFSDEQSTPLSNVLPVTISRTAFTTSADRSM